MTRLARTSFFLTVFLGLLTNLDGSEVCVCPSTIVSQPVVTTVYRPLRVAPGVVLPESPIRQVSDVVIVEEPRTVVHKPAIPKSAPTEVDESKTVPPPFDPISFDSLTVRGQVGGVALDERPPSPEGPIGDPSAIPDSLMQDPTTAGTAVSTATSTSGVPMNATSLTNGMLLIVTVAALGLLFYFIGMTLDYRQRWMQLQMSQNSRLAPSFDDASLGFVAYSDDADLYSVRRFDPVEL